MNPYRASPVPLAALAALLCAAALPASAAAPAASAPAASAPAAIVVPAEATKDKPQKRPATPEEMRDSATAPGVLRPESRVTPQINVPLNPSGAGKPTYVPPPRGKAAASGGVDDSAARCNAIADADARKACLDKLR